MLLTLIHVQEESSWYQNNSKLVMLAFAMRNDAQFLLFQISFQPDNILTSKGNRGSDTLKEYDM